MVPWRIAWRSKRAALRAALVPFCLIFALYFLGEGLIEEIVGRIIGAGNLLLAAQASLTLTLTLYMAIDGLLIAALLEMLLSGRKLADSMPPLVPVDRAFRFALALIPIGLVASLLHVALRHGVAWGVAEALAWRLEDPHDDLARSPLVSLLMLFLDTSAIQWLVAGPAVAPLALRLLSLPALTAQGHAPPSAKPTLELIWLLLMAVALGTFLQVASENAVVRGLEAVLGAIPGVNTTAAPIIVSEKLGGLAGSYVLTFVTTLLIASSVAALLWRRHRSSDAVADDPGVAMPKEGP